MPSDREVIEEYFVRAADPATCKTLYAEECVLHYGGAHALSGDYRGVEGILGLFERSATTFTTPIRLRLLDLATSDEHAFALLRATVGGLPTDEVSWLRSVVFRLVDGKIVEQWLFDYDDTVVAGMQR